MTAEIVKQKWKNLRDSYIKYINYLKGSTGSGKKYKNWHLEFLRDTVAPRATTSNVSVSQIHEISITDEDNEPGESDSENVTSPTQISPPKRTTKRKELTEDVAAVLRKTKISNKTHTKLDHIDNLFLSYLVRLRHFRQERKLSLKCHSYMDELNLMRLTVIIQHAPLQCTPQLRLGQMSTQTKFAENDTGNAIQALNYSNVYTDVNPNEAAENDTGNANQSLNYSNIHTHPKSTNSLVLGSYPIRTQSTKDLYENVSKFIATQPKNNY
ncbi:unnamed protein product [Macrosiphum euphorbiae]|uniref:MADF domain-containing protein n=1 Tax=Macrosiphum euphorbiae TaxID=13131 RepID=A0AAV0XWJ3_9HEMI|nr:unnamed protein product [Macrosiphum euphorbiae]